MTQLSTLGASATRIQGVTAEQTVSAGPATLHRIVASNADASNTATITLNDGSTTLSVLTVGTATSRTYEFGTRHATSILVTPSDADLDLCVVYS